MAKKKKQADIEELEEFEELEEVEETEADVQDDSGMLSAKEAAKLIGTDARTLRKFLRKKAGKVGQGNRWLIDPDEVDDLKTEFEAAQRPKATDDGEKPKAKKAKPPASDEEIYGSDDEDDDEDELEEPTDEDIEELEAEEDDDDEFDILDDLEEI